MDSVIKLKRKLTCRRHRRKKKLMRLSLTDLPWEDVIFTYIFPHLSIKDLCILQGVSRSFRSLYCAYLKQCYKLDFSSYNIPSDGFYRVTQHCENLRWLSIARCPNIEDKPLCSLFAKNHMLQFIYLNSCPKLTQAALQACAINCLALKGLWIGDSHWLQSGGLQVIMLHLGNLKHLDISHCWDVDHTLLNKLVMRYSSVVELGLNYVESVNDCVLTSISSYCKDLETLLLRGCWRITDVGIQKIMEWCPKLKILDIRSCRNITLKYMCMLHMKKVKVYADYSMAQLVNRRRRVHIGLNLQV